MKQKWYKLCNKKYDEREETLLKPTMRHAHDKII